MKKDFEIGTIRINSSSFGRYIKTSSSWDLEGEISENLRKIINLYVKKKSLNYLIDEKHSEFLKGSVNSENKISGERIISSIALLKSSSETLIRDRKRGLRPWKAK